MSGANQDSPELSGRFKTALVCSLSCNWRCFYPGAANSALFVVRTRQTVHVSTLPGDAECRARYQAPQNHLSLHPQPASSGQVLVQLLVQRESLSCPVHVAKQLQQLQKV